MAAPSTVIAVSAMLVVSTTLRTPWGGLPGVLGVLGVGSGGAGLGLGLGLGLE